MPDHDYDYAGLAQWSYGQARECVQSSFVAGASLDLDRVDKFRAIQAALRHAEKLQEIVAKLPVTADGVRVVPGMKVWITKNYDGLWFDEPLETHVHELGDRLAGNRLFRMGGFFVTLEWCYSTRAAAEAARTQQ